MVDLSIIIPTIRPRNEIEVLPALADQTFDDYEILIQEEEGASTARNEGVRRASSDKLVFLDDDSVPMEIHLETASEALTREPLVAGRIRVPREQSGILAELPRHYDHGTEGKYVDTATGCNMAMRREVIDAVGGFDENFKIGHEETDLIRRAREEGYRIWYEPGMEVRHEFADSILDYWRKEWYQAAQGVYFDRKHDINYWRRITSCIPCAPISDSVSEFFVRSIGKGVRALAKVHTLLFDDIPDHRNPKHPL